MTGFTTQYMPVNCLRKQVAALLCLWVPSGAITCCVDGADSGSRML